MKYSQSNLEGLYRLIGAMPEQEFHSGMHYDYIKTWNSVWPNQIINLKVTENDFYRVMDGIEENSQKGTIPNILMLSPELSDNFVLDGLKIKNYDFKRWSAMTHDLSASISRNEVRDFTIKPVENERDLNIWQKIVETELINGQGLNPDIFTWLLANKSCHFFLGIEKSKPVATTLLYVNENGGGIYLVATKKANRRKGIGAEMTRVCLEKAKGLNCNQVDIQATELGKRVYASLGFSDQGVIHVFRIKRPERSTLEGMAPSP